MACPILKTYQRADINQVMLAVRDHIENGYQVAITSDKRDITVTYINPYVENPGKEKRK